MQNCNFDLQSYNILLALNLEDQMFVKSLVAELTSPHMQGVWSDRGERFELFVCFNQTIALKVMVKISLNS